MPLQSRVAFHRHGEALQLCDWLLVNKEATAVWGLWGANYRRERGRMTMTGFNRGRKDGEKKQTRVGERTPLLITGNQKDLLIPHRKPFNPLRHIKPLDINRLL